MGLFDVFKRSAAIAAGASTVAPRVVEISSPLSEGQLTRIVWSDVFGHATGVMTREDALALPAVFKARAVLLALLADKPLVAYDAAEVEAAEAEGRDPKPAANQPAWLRWTAGPVSPWHRMAATIDDLVFYGWSLWAVKRDEAGVIVEAQRYPIGKWKFAEDGSGAVLVDDKPVDEEAFVLIPGPSEGLLAYASRSLRGASRIEDAWVDRAENPIPMVELHQTVESNIDETEAKVWVDGWNKARQEGGGAAFTPYDIQANALGVVAADLYSEGRNNARIDVGNWFNLPASLLDGSVSTASLTYSTQEGDANEVAIYSVPYWRDPLVGRLSQDDVAGDGVVIRMNLGGLVAVEQSATGDLGNE